MTEWPRRRPVLCAVTDRHRLGGAGIDTDRLVAFIAAAARADLDLVQVREPDWEIGLLYQAVVRGLEEVRGSTLAIVVNDRIDVALAAGADGVHLREDSVPAARARAIVPPPRLLGRSVHSPHQVDAVDYLIAGTVFTTASKPGQPELGESGLAAIVASAAPRPVLAIGGVQPCRMAAIARTGAAGVAAIGCFADAWAAGASDLAGLVAELREQFRANSPLV